MTRKQRRMRGGENIAWFECRTNSTLAEPPGRGQFQGPLTGDLFISWGDEEQACRVWKVEVSNRQKVTWEDVKWGQINIPISKYFAITASGMPSWVEKSTWEKNYRRKEYRMAHVEA